MRRSLAIACLVLAQVACGKPPTQSTTFRVAFLSDTHLIDQYYGGPENTPLDTESIFHSEERLTKTRDVVNRIVPAVERVFVSGDITHDLASTDPAFYDTNRTVFDTANDLFSGFKAPVFLGFGNHDYDTDRISRAGTEAIFMKKLGKFMPAAYYAVDYKGWRFIHLNCFEGYTWDNADPRNDSSYGSFGREQLNWLDKQLADGKPSVLMFHIPVFLIKQDEYPDISFQSVIQAHPNIVKMIIAGHMHLWFDMGTFEGAPHIVIAATRYDENAFAVADLTTDTHEFRFVHQELWHLQGHGAEPWPASELK